MDKEQEKKINTTHEDQPAKEHLKVKSIIFWNSNLNCKLEKEIRAWTHGPKCSANPITVTPIWKWEFDNKEHPIRSLYTDRSNENGTLTNKPY